MSQSADTSDAEAFADEDVGVVLESICFSCPPTIVDEQMQSQCDSGCVDLKQMKSCVAYLWLTQSFQSYVQMACLNLK